MDIVGVMPKPKPNGTSVKVTFQMEHRYRFGCEFLPWDIVHVLFTQKAPFLQLNLHCSRLNTILRLFRPEVEQGAHHEQAGLRQFLFQPGALLGAGFAYPNLEGSDTKYFIRKKFTKLKIELWDEKMVYVYVQSCNKKMTGVRTHNIHVSYHDALFHCCSCARVLCRR